MRFVLLLCLILPLSLAVAGCFDNKQNPMGPLDPLLILNSMGEERTQFQVEVVSEAEEMRRGLMFRESMRDDRGMLFDFDGPEAERGFWMKNTLIPLDMIFIKADGTIHYIHENAVPHDLTSIRSQGPVAAVLEINGGLSRKLGIQKGDKVKHTVFQLK